MTNKPTLTLYGRTYCHLCDDMLAALEKLSGEFVFEVAVDDELVPVLTGHDGIQLCHYFLETEKVREYLGRFR